MEIVLVLKDVSNRLVARNLAAIGLLLSAAGLAHAGPTYQYSVNGSEINQNASGGQISSIVATYDTMSEQFSWSYTATNNNDGFWLVVSPDANPKGTPDELAILFGDTSNNRLTAYVYNGQNSSNSLSDPGTLLASFEGAVQSTPVGGTNTQVVSLSIDATAINAAFPNGTGVAFGEKIGIWFHPVAGSNFQYDTDTGRITDFSVSSAGWVDNSGQITTQIPEPRILALAGIGLLAFGLSRLLNRRRLPIVVSTRGVGDAHVALAV